MFDVTVIGGGPAGVTAALRARELGASVALVGLAARRVPRDLGDVPIAPQWGSLRDPRAAEWERSEV